MSVQRLTFAEHINELRRRTMWAALFVAIGAGIGYVLNDRIIWLLQQPLGERLYYTTPTGAFSFVIKVCCAFGFIVSLPVVLYQGFGFFEPMIRVKTRRLLLTYVAVSVLLACAGIAFAYFISLPAALHFLVNFGNSAGDIHAMITAEEYFNFVLAYVAGFAVLFQLPLIIIFINKIKPLQPKRLMGGTRYVILGSFAVSAIITPTPDPINQALMAGPIILLYFMSVLAVAVTNFATNRHKQYEVLVPETPIYGVETLLREDTKKITLAPTKTYTNTGTAALATFDKAKDPLLTRTDSAHRHRFVNDIITAPSPKQANSIPANNARAMQNDTIKPQTIGRKSHLIVRVGVI